MLLAIPVQHLEILVALLAIVHYSYTLPHVYQLVLHYFMKTLPIGLAKIVMLLVKHVQDPILINV